MAILKPPSLLSYSTSRIFRNSALSMVRTMFRKTGSQLSPVNRGLYLVSTGLLPAVWMFACVTSAWGQQASIGWDSDGSRVGLTTCLDESEPEIVHLASPNYQTHGSPHAWFRRANFLQCMSRYLACQQRAKLPTREEFFQQ